MEEGYGDRRAAEHAWSHGEGVGKKLPTPVEQVHTSENEEARLEEVETIQALREKVSALRLEQGDCPAQIVSLKEAIEATAEDTLPALTGERVRQLKDYQVKKMVIDASLSEYSWKLQGAEARYQTVFPQFPLES